MERTDWLDEGLDPADARFLMLTAITHHQFSSPIWGEHEVRKLHAELALPNGADPADGPPRWTPERERLIRHLAGSRITACG